MARAGATLILLTTLFFLAAAPWERCEQDNRPCAPACHLLCLDSCTQSPLTDPPPLLAPAPSPERLAALVALRPGRRVDPPELPPPRR